MSNVRNLPAPQQAGSAVRALTLKLAERFGLDNVDPQELVDTLKATAFKDRNGNPASDAQMTALLIVADQYGLNPWLKEIHAFSGQGGGIVPIVGVDGWSNIINSHPQMDGMEFEVNWTKGDEHITCTIWRKDRSKPIKVTEWLEECVRSTDPWKMKRRMLRHKAMMQCGRVAFGLGNIYDPDEAQDVIKNMGMVEEVGQQPQARQQPTAAAGDAPMPNTGTGELAEWPAEAFEAKVPKFREYLAKGKTVEEILAFYGKQGRFTEDQIERIKALAAEKAKPAPTVIDNPAEAAPALTYAQVADKLNAAKNLDELTLAADLIRQVADEGQRKELTAIFEKRGEELSASA